VEYCWTRFLPAASKHSVILPYHVLMAPSALFGHELVSSRCLRSTAGELGMLHIQNSHGDWLPRRDSLGKFADLRLLACHFGSSLLPFDQIRCWTSGWSTASTAPLSYLGKSRCMTTWATATSPSREASVHGTPTRTLLRYCPCLLQPIAGLSLPSSRNSYSKAVPIPLHCNNQDFNEV
jgi:hypothetical protein